MAKVLVCYEPVSDIPCARYYGGDTHGNPIPGEDVELELRRAAAEHQRQGHVTFLVDHYAPHAMHHDEVVEQIARHRAEK